jgi:hypothetical protein
LIQSSGAGRIEQLRVSAAGVSDFEREEHKDSSACTGEFRHEYCPVRTACARYWALSEKQQDYVRPTHMSNRGCDKRVWLIDDASQRERFHIKPFMSQEIDWLNIMEMSRERQENVDGS